MILLSWMKVNKRRLEIRKAIVVAKMYPLFLFYSICKNCTMLYIFYSWWVLRSSRLSPWLWYWCCSWSPIIEVNIWYQWGSYHWRDGLYPERLCVETSLCWETSINRTIWNLLPFSFCFRLKDAIFVLLLSFL